MSSQQDRNKEPLTVITERDEEIMAGDQNVPDVSSRVDPHFRVLKRELEEQFKKQKVVDVRSTTMSPRGRDLTSQSPRERTRLLEHQRLRDFAAALPIEITRDEKAQSSKTKMFNTFVPEGGASKDEILIPSPPGLEDKDPSQLIAERSDQEKLVSEKLERFEAALHDSASHTVDLKTRALVRKLSVLRVKFEADKQTTEDIPKGITWLPSIKRADSIFRKSAAKAAEREKMLALIQEVDTVEHAVIKWSSSPNSSPKEVLRELTIFRISVMTALENHDFLMDSILLQLSELETTIMDYRAKEKRNDWCRSKEALRRIAVLRSRLSQPDWDVEYKDPVQNKSPVRAPRRTFSLFGS